MSFWTPDTIRAACAGTWIARPPAHRRGSEVVRGLSTDSRTIAPGQAFLALRGGRFDGHAYLRDAVRSGASMLIVDTPGAVPHGGFLGPDGGPAPVAVLRVADTGKALLKLAAAYRRTLETTKVIAVAGSAGKTTTTRLIDALLSSRLRGSASPRSYNNAVGVPLTILGAQSSDQYLICEVGTNAPGEIAVLGQIVEPDLAVITSIGREHLEGLGSIEGVVKEEAAILSYLRPGGAAVATADAPGLEEYLKCVPNVVTFGRSERADLRLTSVEHVGEGEGGGVRFTVNDRATYRVPLLGEHNALNALAAIAVAKRLGIPDEVIADALAAARGPEMRLERLSIAGIEVINDAYNANPESTLAALRTLAQVGRSARRRVAVLGDMLELGQAAPDAHREIGQAVLELGTIDLVVIVGHLGLYTAERLCREPDGWSDERYVLVSDLDRGQAAGIAALLRPGDMVLLKGSRRMRLERVVEALKERHGVVTKGAEAAAGVT